MRPAGRSGILWETPRSEGAVIRSNRASVLGRPISGAAIDLEQTACYTCTGWHTCLVFVTEVGLKVPLCEACLPFVVERAVERQRLAS